MSATREVSDSYLRWTTWCDIDHPAVRALAAELTRHARTTREAAIALYDWVRDGIVYAMGERNQRASETIARRHGTCASKANVMVALARAIGIPAGFHVQHVAAPAYFAGAYIPLIERHSREVVVHVYPALFIDGHWVRCDPSDDRVRSDAISAIVPHAGPRAFDGTRDSVRAFPPGSIRSDKGPLLDIDGHLSSRVQRSPAIERLFGMYIAYLRANGARHTLDSEAGRARLEAEFCRHLRAFAPSVLAELCDERARAA